MGTRNSGDICQKITKDHPHAYGDKNIFDIKYYADRGSSPRVWGQAKGESRSSHASRIIPTRMGTSDFGYFAALGVGDHPHAYGDKSPFTFFFYF